MDIDKKLSDLRADLSNLLYDKCTLNPREIQFVGRGDYFDVKLWGIEISCGYSIEGKNKRYFVMRSWIDRENFERYGLNHESICCIFGFEEKEDDRVRIIEKNEKVFVEVRDFFSSSEGDDIRERDPFSSREYSRRSFQSFAELDSLAYHLAGKDFLTYRK